MGGRKEEGGTIGGKAAYPATEEAAEQPFGAEGGMERILRASEAMPTV